MIEEVNHQSHIHLTGMVKVKKMMIQRGGVIHERKYFLLSFEFQQDVIEHEATEEFIQTWITMWSPKTESNRHAKSEGF